MSPEERVINLDAFTECFKDEVASKLGLEDWGEIVIDLGKGISEVKR